ncbi:hypothetical protein DCC62_23775, partial [candidate division KSB1 bacterium]
MCGMPSLNGKLNTESRGGDWARVACRRRSSICLTRFWPFVFLYVVFLSLNFAGPAHAQVATIKHPHGNIKIPCNACHTTKGWSPLLQELKFKHEATGFALEGQHAAVDCKKCHTSLKFTGTSNECTACHNDVHDGTLGKDCERCHTVQGWLEMSK